MLVAAGADPNADTGGGRAGDAAALGGQQRRPRRRRRAHRRRRRPGKTGCSIGTPLDNAIGYGCWHVARLLARRGARVDKLWHAAALGLMPRVQELLAASPPPGPREINEAFWQACHGGQRRTAEYLLRHGADINTTVEYAHGTPLDTATSLDTRRDTLATWLREHGAQPVDT